jgi:hypothetical protein
LDLTPDQATSFFFQDPPFKWIISCGHHGVSHFFVGAQGKLVLLLLVNLPSIAGHGFLAIGARAKWQLRR